MISNLSPEAAPAKSLAKRLGSLKPGMCNFTIHMPAAVRRVAGRATTLLQLKSDSRAGLRWMVSGLERDLPRAGRLARQLVVNTFGEKIFSDERAHTVRESRDEFMESI